MLDDEPILDAVDALRIVAHYERVAPMLVASFAGVPLTTVFLPNGPSGDTVRVGQLVKPVPPSIPTIAVTTRNGLHRYIALAENSLLWRAHEHAVGFESWAPLASDPLAPHFARIVVRGVPGTPLAVLRTAIQNVIFGLNECDLDGAIVLAGTHATVWIPLAAAPPYEALRGSLYTILDDVCTMFDGPVPAGITFSVRSNAAGLGTGLPYTLRAEPGFPMNVPITQDELATVEPFAFELDDIPERLARLGDFFAREIARIGDQNATSLPTPKKAHHLELGPLYETPEPRSEVITLALAVLADGKPRLVEEIERDAAARGLWPQNERRKYVYATLKAYIEKCVARNQKPLITQDADRRFRLNHPADDLPAPRPDAHWAVPQHVIDALHATAAGTDPTAFEVAVCNAFEQLGFVATHIGGTMNPDGYLDALLGPLGYRVMLECKSGTKPLVRPDVFEAGKFKDTYHAQFCVMVAPAYAGDTETRDEANNHGVALWSVDDLAALLTLGANAYELRALFAPGITAERVADLQWSRDHGDRKRLTVVCDALCDAGWRAQSAAATFHAPEDAPLLTEDAAMLLVDEYLQDHGSHTPCTRDDVRNAFAYLTSPRVARAVWTDAGRTAIVILAPPAGA